MFPPAGSWVVRRAPSSQRESQPVSPPYDRNGGMAEAMAQGNLQMFEGLWQ